jgi:hypothetical protein
MKENDLLPCPFCGSKARRLEYPDGEKYDEVWCSNDPECAARVEGDTYEQAVKIWNRRVSEVNDEYIKTLENAILKAADGDFDEMNDILDQF